MTQGEETLFGLPVPDIREALRAVGIVADSHQQLSEIFARCVWNTVTEPGDSQLGALITEKGVTEALRMLLEHNLPSELSDAAERWRQRLNLAMVMPSLRAATEVGAILLTPHSEYWPQSVSDLGNHQPIVLWCRGDVSALGALERSVSVVGARASTGYGEHVTYDLVSGLVDRGFTIISGAAYGIDGVAHRTALASGGTTIALMAGGIDRFYPSGHDTLLRNIEQSGAVLAELPCGSAPTRWRFLQRNRLIAALSPVTVVVEAGWRSGSLNTAHHAAALGRVLAAVPGPVTSPSSAGCHRIMREADATCVTSASDIAELISIDGSRALELEAVPTGDYQRVLDALTKRTPRQLTELERTTGFSFTQLRVALAELEIQGLVADKGTGWVLA